MEGLAMVNPIQHLARVWVAAHETAVFLFFLCFLYFIFSAFTHPYFSFRFWFFLFSLCFIFYVLLQIVVHGLLKYCA
jgi:hypothetical protein